jgi:hypothetical protein
VSAVVSESVVDRGSTVTRRNPRRWIAGVLWLLASTAPLANDHTHAIPRSHSPFLLFYSYPLFASQPYAPQRRVHRYVVKSPVQYGNPLYALSDGSGSAPGGQSRFRLGHAPGNPYLAPLNSVQAGSASVPPAYTFGLPSDPPSGPPTAASGDDEWSFRANPLLNLNHAHERGATFSIRHDF